MIKKTPKKFLLLLLIMQNISVLANNTQLTNAYFNLAEVLASMNNTEEAFANYQKALAIDPMNLPTLLGLGKLYLNHKKNYDKAIELFEKRLKVNPKCEKTEFYIAKSFELKKDIESAMQHYKNALAINPKFTAAYKELIQTLCSQRKTDEAIQKCQQALKNNPLAIGIRNKLIELLMNNGKLNEALVHCNKLITIQPTNNNLQIKKAQILTKINRLDESIQIFENLLKKQPNNTKIIYNIAYLTKQVGKYEKAINLFKKVLATDPNNRKAILGLSQSYIALGYFKNGWELMDKYNTKTESNTRLKKIEDISGKIILIQGEWYTEDMIQLVRYAKLIKEKGAKEVVVQSPEQLVSLFKHCPYIDKVINMNTGETHAYNKLVPISSLPNIFETKKEHIPCNIPYLYPPQDLFKLWEEKLLQDNKCKIGVYINSNDIPVTSLMEIAGIKNISVYTLNNISGTNYLKNVPNDKIVHNFGTGFNANEKDILQLSAIIPNLDVIITSDSFVAHLAGAIGAPVWLILTKNADYRWMEEDQAFGWYPTMKLFRQKETADWQNTIDEIKTCLQNIVEEKID